VAPEGEGGGFRLHFVAPEGEGHETDEGSAATSRVGVSAGEHELTAGVTPLLVDLMLAAQRPSAHTQLEIVRTRSHYCLVDILMIRSNKRGTIVTQSCNGRPGGVRREVVDLVAVG
jgi:hypothetical protein